MPAWLQALRALNVVRQRPGPGKLSFYVYSLKDREGSFLPAIVLGIMERRICTKNESRGRKPAALTSCLKRHISVFLSYMSMRPCPSSLGKKRSQVTLSVALS